MEKKIAENKTIIEDLQKSVHNFIEKQSQINQTNDDKQVKVTNNFFSSQKDLENNKSFHNVDQPETSQIKLNIHSVNQTLEHKDNIWFDGTNDKEEQIK